MSVVERRWTQIIGATAVMFALVAAAAITTEAQESSVWAGVYTEDQAKRGEAASNKFCSSCHGPDLSGGEAGPSLVGVEFIGNWNTLTLADFYDRVNATMPADAPGTLTPQQTSDAMAYVLKMNKYPAGQTELSTDIAALKNIKIEGQQK